MDLVLQIVTSGLLTGGIYALLAVGLTLIFGVLRVVNFAHGEFMMLGMYGAFWMWALWDLDPYVSVFAVVPAVFALGLLTDRLIIRHTIGAPEVTVVFATLGLSIFLQNFALTVWSADTRSVTTGYTGTAFSLGEVRASVPLVVSFVVALGLALALWALLTYTRFGKSIQAVAQNRDAAALMGINVGRVYMLTYAIAVAGAGAMGALAMPVFSAFPRVGLSFVITAFVIVVLGGLGSVVGAVVAALLIGVVQSVVGFLIGAAWAEIAYFLVFIAVLVLRPQGLLGRRGAEVYQGA
ncbi:branched-chain amino acid ABC transporter permease [Egibacter rhizosphaerae]|uniref:Branched-chain amino acid ABC transporter permease n=1 Tax=Egibacter rhizosphaerae TaxID=1670831 RepID=A0A411YEU9_9ACTN|nr:branched-chain amino acid ABC transporter permease [Egibacter rhizosphaerae]QBI19784.1 branched-chain amino acid ABC transporter permease [Egibacter rhizosphaerae]